MKPQTPKPILQMTAKKLPTLQMTTYPSKPVQGAMNIRLAKANALNKAKTV